MTILNTRRVATAAAFVAAFALQTPRAWSANDSVENIDVFELEGNATQESGGTVGPPPVFGADDWTNILILGGKSTVDPANADPKGTTQGVGITLVPGWPGVLKDPAPNTIFTTGGGKDILDVTQWQWKNGSVPPKDDITDAYAAAYVLGSNFPNCPLGTEDKNCNGDVVIYFGEDRATTNGAAQLGFWFLQQNVAPVAGGTFSGAHTVGDILVLVNFTIGGTVATIDLLEWVGTGGEISGTLHQLEAPTNHTCAPGILNDKACAITNAVTTTLPWTNPETGTTQFPPQSFYEGGINLSRVFRVDVKQPLPCVTTFLAESRSSPSPTATLKDFVLGSFTLCGFDVTKECTAGALNQAQTGFDWTFDGTVTNTGPSALFVTVTDTPNQGTIYEGAPTTIASNQMVAGGATFNFGPSTYSTVGMAPNPSSDTVTVTASVTSGGPVILTKSKTATCPQVTGSPNLAVTKLCSGDDPHSTPQNPLQPLGVFLDVVNGQIVVKVKVDAHVCNTGTVNLTNLNVTDDDGQNASTPMAVNDTLNVGQCKDYTEIYTPNGHTLMPPVTSTSTVTFTDTVTATAKAVLGFGDVGPVTASPAAPCPLCVP